MENSKIRSNQATLHVCVCITLCTPEKLCIFHLACIFALVCFLCIMFNTETANLQWVFKDYRVKILLNDKTYNIFFQIKEIRELSGFLGYHLTELKVLTLDDHLHIKNHRKHGAEAMANGNKDAVQVCTKPWSISGRAMVQ